jgi:hypothetical protein
MVAFELAGRVEDDLGSAGGGSPTGVVSGGQPLIAAVAKATPGGADGVIGQSQFGGDLGQGLAIEMAPDDVQSGIHGEGAGHERPS